mgnify:CR=1 FL=1
MAVKVIDVSSYQPDIDYAAVKAAGISGAIIRSSLMYWGDQNMVKESCVDKHYNGFHSVGVPMGVYHYSCATTPEMAREEARLVLDIVKDKQLEYPIYYDTENNERQGSLPKEKLTEIAIAFCEEIEKAGYYAGIYTSLNWFKNKLDCTKLEQYDKWVAQYHTECQFSESYGMWQYTSQGHVAGISGNVDMSVCYQDYPTIIRQAGLNHLSGSTPAPSPAPEQTVSGTIYKLGQRVTFSTCYRSSTDTTDKAISAANMARNTGVITRIIPGARQPYLLDNGLCWVNDGDIRSVDGASTDAPAALSAIQEDDRVQVKQGARSYEGAPIASFVYSGTYTVDELRGDRAVLDQDGICTAFRVSDLTKT